MTTGNMFLTHYFRQLEEQAKKSDKAEEVKQASPAPEEKPKTVKRSPKKK